MLQKAFNNEHGQWLAVVSGRFLPVRDISISVEQDVDMMATAATMSKNPVKSVRETITVEFDTARDPMLRGWSQLSRAEVDTVFVNRKYQLLVPFPTVFIGGNTAGEELLWSLEVTGKTYELRKR